MKKVLVIAITLLISSVTFGQQYSNPLQSPKKASSTLNNLYNTPSQTNPNLRFQDGYYRDNGTYVQPHMKTESNSTNWDNFSTEGNTNPYTQQKGTRARDYSSESLNYGQGKQIYTGERGGQYYINSNGNKTYVPKRSDKISW